jgi:hypothetical protein
MEIIINVGFSNGNVSIKADSYEEAGRAKGWLVEQGLLSIPNMPAPQAAPVEPVEPFNAGAKVHPIGGIVEPDNGGEHEAALVAEAEAQQEAEEAAAKAAEAAAAAAAEKAAAAAAKKAAAAAKKAAAADAGKPANSIADVTKAVTDYAAKFGPNEARALFSRFGVSRGGDLKPEQFDEFVSVARDYIERGIKASDAQMPEGADLM